MKRGDSGGCASSSARIPLDCSDAQRSRCCCRVTSTFLSVSRASTRRKTRTPEDPPDLSARPFLGEGTCVEARASRKRFAGFGISPPRIGARGARRRRACRRQQWAERSGSRRCSRSAAVPGSRAAAETSNWPMPKRRPGSGCRIWKRVSYRHRSVEAAPVRGRDRDGGHAGGEQNQQGFRVRLLPGSPDRARPPDGGNRRSAESEFIAPGTRCLRGRRLAWLPVAVAPVSGHRRGRATDRTLRVERARVEARRRLRP